MINRRFALLCALLIALVLGLVGVRASAQTVSFTSPGASFLHTKNSPISSDRPHATFTYSFPSGHSGEVVWMMQAQYADLTTSDTSDTGFIQINALGLFNSATGLLIYYDEFPNDSGNGFVPQHQPAFWSSNDTITVQWRYRIDAYADNVLKQTWTSSFSPTYYLSPPVVLNDFWNIY